MGTFSHFTCHIVAGNGGKTDVDTGIHIPTLRQKRHEDEENRYAAPRSSLRLKNERQPRNRAFVCMTKR